MAELPPLESAWLIELGEIGVDMDQAFADYSIAQEWRDAGIFPGDHECLLFRVILLMVLRGCPLQKPSNHHFAFD